MTREDTERLFDLLAVYRPGDRHLEDKTLRSAWALVLEPFEPGNVKAAVAAYFREKKYWPDVTDIASRCPKPAEQPEAQFDRCPPANGAEKERWARWKALVERRRAAGRPGTVGEALAAGLAPEVWMEMLDAAGLALEGGG